MRKEAIAGLLVLIMLAAMGYVIMNNDGNESNLPDDDDNNNEISDEWDVYYVDSGDDLPACGSATLGRLYYVASTAGFETCTNTGWAFVDLTGPAGPAGVNGTDGVDGADGVNGTDGASGSDGTNGLSALAVTSMESAGSNCPDGGLKIEVGVDENSNGSLDEDEVDHTQYICNGADGQDGQNGQDGLDGDDGSASPNTMLTSISTPTLQACSSGGRIINQGLDNGDGGGTAQNGILESVEIDYTTTYCSNFVITRITDLNINPGSSPWGNGVRSSSRLATMGTSVFFSGYADFYGGTYELWLYDTKTTQTQAVVNLGGNGANGFTQSQPVAMETTLFFEGFVDGVGRSLVAYESTNDSTWVVADLCPSSTSTTSSHYCGQVDDFIVMGTKVFFTGRTGTSYPWNDELWVHDTTNDSTWQVVDINSGGFSGIQSAEYAVMGTRLYFEASDGINGFELWAHETTNDSTWQVADINPSGNGWAGGITVMGTRLYFTANDGNSGTELWAHESTNDSTWQVANINEGSGHGFPNYITVMGTRIYFQGTGETFATGSAGSELWAHESTNDSTWLVADINLHASQPNMGPTSDSSAPSYITAIGTRLYFKANDGISGAEVWVHETTNGSTWQVSDICAGSCGSDVRGFVTIGSQIFFIADDGGLFDRELWMMEIEHTITYD